MFRPENIPSTRRAELELSLRTEIEPLRPELEPLRPELEPLRTELEPLRPELEPLRPETILESPRDVDREPSLDEMTFSAKDFQVLLYFSQKSVFVFLSCAKINMS